MAKKPTQPVATAETVSEPTADLTALPPRVAALRARILEAVASGDIESLHAPIEWNETIPLFARGPGQPKSFADAIDMLKKRSFDGKGRETLSILGAIFE